MTDFKVRVELGIKKAAGRSPVTAVVLGQVTDSLVDIRPYLTPSELTNSEPVGGSTASS